MSQPVLKTETDSISLTKIDNKDHTCLLSPSVRPAPIFLKSIETVGLINPPLVVDKKNGTYGIVCGFRRIHACKMLGWREIDVRILLGEHSSFDLLQYAIWDNRSHRPFNVVEQAQGIHRLGPHIPQEKRLDILSSLLGFPANKKVFEKITRIGLLPHTVQLGILEDKISLEAAVSLDTLAVRDAEMIFNLLANLKMSQNKQKELITMIKEIAIIEDLEISGVLCSLGIDDLTRSPDLNRNEKGRMIRKCLKERRFPALASAEARFEETVRRLKLPEKMHITSPPYFEGQSYALRLDFKCLEDLEACRQRLETLIRDPAMKRLLEP